MKKFILSVIAVAWLCCALSVRAEDSAFKTPVFDAMRAELTRNGTRLKAENYPLPYFLAYTVTQIRELEVQAAFGSIVNDELLERTLARAELRVGDIKFDNSNFVNGFGQYNDYLSWTDISGGNAALRRALWDISDSSYNAAVQALAKKQALAKTKNLADKPDDFSPSTPTVYAGVIKPSVLNRDELRDSVRSASALFRNYPDIMTGSISVEYSDAVRNYLNSEGSAVRTGGAMFQVYMSASAMAPDGMPVKRNCKLYFTDGDIPSKSELQALTEKFASGVTDSVHGSTLTAYVGPVLFEGNAAGQLFARFFAVGVYSPRPSWTEFGQESLMGDFHNRLDLRVMSSLFAVTDNPLAKEYNGKGLVGSFEVDAEGVPAREVALVKKGKLTDFLMGRAPAKYRYASNGHARSGLFSSVRGSASNLFFTPSATVPDAKLKDKLIALCRDYDLEYGIVVRDASNFSGDMEIYKVYAADGREEPLRSVQFDGLTGRVLRDIAAAGSALNVYNTLVNDIPVSIVAPSVLVSEAELKAVDTKPEKIPYLKHPYFDKK